MSFKNILFREAAIADTAGAATEVEPKSIAELMSKHGVVNNSMSPIAEPIENIKPEKKEETKEPEKVIPAATAKEPKEVVETKTESPAKEEKKAEVTPQKADTEAKVQTWQEVLKAQPDTEVLKAMGLDEKAINIAKKLNGFEKVDYFDKLLSEWISTGKIDSFARELSTDYTKMPAGEVMRHQLRQEYPKASEKALDVLYRKEVVEKYNLESDDETEKEEGQLLLEAKADKFRDEYIKNQQDYLTPKPPEPAKEVVPDNTAAIERAKEIERVRKTFDESPYTKSILENKVFTFGEGEYKFTYPLNTERMMKYLSNDKSEVETGLIDVEKDDKGNITKFNLNPEHSILMSMIAVHGKDFIDKLAQHFKGKGGKAVVKSIDNAKETSTTLDTKVEEQPTTPAGAMAKSGKLVNPGGG